MFGLALSQLSPADEERVRGRFRDLHGVTFPTLGESLRELARLTAEGSRISQRTFGLQLLAKIARNRGTEELQQVGDVLHEYVRASVAEAKRLEGFREHRGHEVEPAEEARAAGKRTSGERGAERPGRADGERQPEDAVADDEIPATAADIFPDAPLIEPDPAAPAPPPPPAPADGPDLEAPDAVTEGVYDGLNAAKSTGMADGTAWEVFSGQAQDTLKLSDAEMDLPKCSDDENVIVDGKGAWRVITTWTSQDPPSKFSKWCDARHWDVGCSLFYKSVQPVPPASMPKGREYSCTFLEVVRFSDSLTLETKLVFTRTVLPEKLYALHFMLAEETESIDVDTGSLIARKGAKGTELTAEKAIDFKDEAMKSWPTLSCDLMWMELSILASLGCVDEGEH